MNHKPILFGAEFCAPCKVLKKLLDDKNIEYEYVDVENNPAMAHLYRIKRLPTMISVTGEVINNPAKHYGIV